MRASGPCQRAVVAMAVGGALTTPIAAHATTPLYKDPSQPVPARVDDLLGRMSLDEKLGQMTQVERDTISPGDLAAHRVGSVLSGGGSAPTPNTPAAWADMYDDLQRAAMSTPLAIPMIYGIDAVHGHNNVAGATIFPHNIGLGATRDPALVQRIGRAVAEEVSGTGVDWDFAPCLCVARDDRWGRTYESFGEQPELAASMASLITGLQGSSLGGSGSVLATAKHFVGDGGTTGGKDQGDTQVSEADLRAIHLPPFKEAVRRGAGSVMVSYSSWNGLKLHAHRYLITDVLKRELAFGGFVVSDWQGIDQIDGQSGFTADEVRTAVNAGIDMVMVPYDYRRFIDVLRGEVRAGRVPMARIDDANRRILTKKFQLGLFERPYTDRAYTGTVGNAAHRAIAREAVRKSQVVLKNKWGLLPLPKTASKVFVAGKTADDTGNQSGGWTLTWQGRSGSVPGATSVLQGIRGAVSPQTTVTYDREGDGIDGSYKAAIAVVGETPYAEFLGDRPNGFGLDAEDLSTLARLKASGVPVVVVLVSGRPLDIAGQLPDWDALVASWLPGSEGAGVADVLFGDAKPVGRLPVSWPASAVQEPINDGDGKAALFPYGFRLDYPTTQDGFDTIGAAYYDDQHGTHVERCSDSGCGQAIAYIAAGDRLAYYDVDFGTGGVVGVTTRIASGSTATGTIEYRLDGPTGPVLARQPVSSTGGWQNWTSVTAPATDVTGVHRVYLVFTGPTAQDFVNVNWFRFSRTAGGAAFDETVRSAQALARGRLAATTTRLDATAWPSQTGPDGRWLTTPAEDWTSGFLPGSLWLAYQESADPSWRTLAQRWQSGLAGQASNTRTHDLGFMLLDSFGQGLRLSGEDAYRQTLLQAAGSLATRYNARVGMTRSWDSDPSEFHVIVDNMMNLELLLWGARNGGDGAWRQMAISHALRTRQDLVRADGSTFHRVIYDPQTGAILRRGTVQGAADDSTWARGQAWALNGFTMVYRETKDPRFLDTARRLTDWFIDHLPSDGVPYWDFAAPGIPNAPRDTSAAAVAASGMLELSRLEPDGARAARYLATAKKILTSLAAPPYLSRGSGSESTLLHGTANAPAGNADTGLVYGDYFFQQALLRLRRIPPAGAPLAVSGVTASAHDGNLPANAVDGRLDTRWSAHGDGQWLRLDLGRLRPVSVISAAVYQGDARAARFDLEASTDGTQWRPLARVVSSGQTVEAEHYDVPDTTARYVRLVGHGASVTPWNSITEVAVR